MVMMRPIDLRCERVVAHPGLFARCVMCKTNHNVSWALPITLKPLRRCRNDGEVLVSHQGSSIKW